MEARRCPYCGTLNAGGSRFCSECGRRVPVRKPPLELRPYTALRPQLDPIDPPPPRYARRVALTLGAALVIVGAMLLIVDGIVSAAASGASGACPTGPNASPCVGPIFEYLFVVPGFALLTVGGLLVVVAFLRTL